MKIEPFRRDGSGVFVREDGEVCWVRCPASSLGQPCHWLEMWHWEVDDDGSGRWSFRSRTLQMGESFAFDVAEGGGA